MSHSVFRKLNHRYDGNIYFRVQPHTLNRGQYRLQLSAQPRGKAQTLPIGGRYAMTISQRCYRRHQGKRDKLLVMMLQHFAAMKADFQVFGIPVTEVLDD